MIVAPQTIPITALRPHPRNESIYGDAADPDLVASVRERGILVPLLITSDRRIIAGHRRWQAAELAGVAAAPVVVFGSDDELEILQAVIESNRQRVKTNEQAAREYQVLAEIERERAQARRFAALTRSPAVPENFPARGDSRDIVGRVLGRNGKTLEKASAVVKAIDELAADGREEEATSLRATLNGKSVDRAYRDARSNGLILGAQEPEPKAGPLLLTLSTWRSLSAEQQHAELHRAPNVGATFNEQLSDSIEWARWSWNPVTGCKHDCSYCYARDIALGHTAMKGYAQGFEPTFLPERLDAPSHTKVPPRARTEIGYRNVFTCSMADLFGRWVPREWIDAVLDRVVANPQWTFLFLTKFPQRLVEFDFPDNAWVGTTVDAQARVKVAEEAFANVRASVRWLSLEPLLEPLRFNHLDRFNWIVLGGASRSVVDSTPEWHPPLSWVADLERQAAEVGAHVYHKANLYRRRVDYPGAAVDQPIDVPTAFKMRYLQRDILEPNAYATEVHGD